MNDTITVRYPRGDRQVKVERYVEFHGIRCAVHRRFCDFDSPSSTPGFTVSELETGASCGEGLTIKEAIEAGRQNERSTAKAGWLRVIKKAKARIKKRDRELAKAKGVHSETAPTSADKTLAVPAEESVQVQRVAEPV